MSAASERPRAPPGPDGVPAGSPAPRRKILVRKKKGARSLAMEATAREESAASERGPGSEASTRRATPSRGIDFSRALLPGAETGLGAPSSPSRRQPRPPAPRTPPEPATEAAVAPRGPRANRRGRRAAWDVLGDVAEYETTLRAKIAEERAKLPPTPEHLPDLPHHLQRQQMRVADGEFHDHYSRAYRDLCAEREEFAAMASRLREGNLESGEERAASMNAKAHTGWELHCKMGDEAHARALDAWELRREKWEETKRRIALRHDKRPGDLAMERCDEHRRKMEIMSHLDMAAPVHEREGGMSWEWRMSLRNNWTRYVCVGNVFSELYYVRDELAFADPVHVRRRKNVEDGESYSLARGRSVLSSRYLDARRARLRKRVKDVLPGELDDEDVEMLEVVGEGVASLAERRANRRITFEDLEERIAETSVETWAAIQKRRADERAREANERAARLAERERAEIERLASLGPHVRVRDARLNAEAVVSARDGATQEGETRDAARDGGATKVSTVVHNTGTTALWFRWIREEPPGARALGETLKTLTLARTKTKREKPPSRAFYLAEQEGSLLPGESRVVTWTFKCAAPGVYLDSWRLETRPRPRGGDPPPVSLRGVASLEDVKSFARRGLDAELERRRMRAKVETAVETILKGVRTPSPEKRRATRPEPAPTGREVGLWLAGNRERKPRAYYHPEAFARTWKTLREAEKALAMLPKLPEEDDEDPEKEEEPEKAPAETLDASGDASSEHPPPDPPPWGDWDGSLESLESAVASLAARLETLDPEWEMPERTEEELAQIERDAEEAKAEATRRAEAEGADPPGEDWAYEPPARPHPREVLEACVATLDDVKAVAALPPSRSAAAQAALAEALCKALGGVEHAASRSRRANEPRRKQKTPEEEEAEREAAEAAEAAEAEAKNAEEDSSEGPKSPAPPSPEPPWRAVYRRQLSDDVAALLGDAIDRFEETLLPETEAELAAECDRRAAALASEAAATRGFNSTGGDDGDAGDWAAFDARRRARTLTRRDRGEGYYVRVNEEPSLDFVPEDSVPAERKLRLGAGGKNAKTQKKLDVGGGIERAREEE